MGKRFKRSAEADAEALRRARGCRSVSNMVAVVSECEARGYAPAAVPGENVLTFGAWRALGRSVRKGERGIRVSTWVPIRKRDAATGEEVEVGKRPKVAFVFHVSQTVELEAVGS